MLEKVRCCPGTRTTKGEAPDIMQERYLEHGKDKNKPLAEVSDRQPHFAEWAAPSMEMWAKDNDLIVPRAHVVCHKRS